MNYAYLNVQENEEFNYIKKLLFLFQSPVKSQSNMYMIKTIYIYAQ